MSSTGLPICARTVARLTEVVVLPSRANVEVMTMTFGELAEASSSDVRKARYASEIGERESLCGSRSMPACGFARVRHGGRRRGVPRP